MTEETSEEMANTEFFTTRLPAPVLARVRDYTWRHRLSIQQFVADALAAQMDDSDQDWNVSERRAAAQVVSLLRHGPPHLRNLQMELLRHWSELAPQPGASNRAGLPNDGPNPDGSQ